MRVNHVLMVFYSIPNRKLVLVYVQMEIITIKIRFVNYAPTIVWNVYHLVPIVDNVLIHYRWIHLHIDVYLAVQRILLRMIVASVH